MARLEKEAEGALSSHTDTVQNLRDAETARAKMEAEFHELKVRRTTTIPKKRLHSTYQTGLDPSTFLRLHTSTS